MNFWKGAIAGTREPDCEENGYEWEVENVDSGLATVVVHFNHVCIHEDGSRTEPPSNDIGYVYEVEVDSVNPEEAADEIESMLTDAGSLPELLDVLNGV